jgi:hypothetical protein
VALRQELAVTLGGGDPRRKLKHETKKGKAKPEFFAKRKREQGDEGKDCRKQEAGSPSGGVPEASGAIEQNEERGERENGEALATGTRPLAKNTEDNGTKEEKTCLGAEEKAKDAYGSVQDIPMIGLTAHEDVAESGEVVTHIKENPSGSASHYRPRASRPPPEKIEE